MKKYLLFLVLGVSLSLSSQAQKENIDSIYTDSLRNIEFQLEGLSYNIINGADVTERVTSCYYFIQRLKKALMVPSSFDYEFPLLKEIRTVSILKPDDEKFRMFTWNLLLDSGRYMYFGAIQMGNSDSLELFGLYDSSDYLKEPLFETFDNRHWVGALYYQIHDFKFNKKKHYMLFGWDGEDDASNKKVIDILWFDDNGKPQFGAPVFIVNDDIQSRMIFEFADRAAMLCRYDERENVIVYANTIPPSPMLVGRYEYYLPDGTYRFFKYEKGFWVAYDDFFDDRKKNAHDLRNNNAPR